ncbi:MAG: TetR family transcriptional regulator, partial [Actinomycetota bacterium]|nr:TetR family transcriptional regulator [Actinomycetota bacterium]
MEPAPRSGVDADALSGTKARIAEAALKTLKTRGFAGSSAREIASAGGFNQALIFYHFGSVKNLLVAALDVVSARRMRAYGPAFEQARTASELARLAREIYAEDLENGYVTVLGEMVAGGVSNPELGGAVV